MESSRYGTEEFLMTSYHTHLELASTIVHYRPERGVHSSPYVPTPARRAESDTSVVLHGPIMGDVLREELTDREQKEQEFLNG